MLQIMQTVVWGIAMSMIALASGIGVNKLLPNGYRSAVSISMEKGWHDEPTSVGAWVTSENNE